MLPKLIIGERKSGRTTDLIVTSAAAEKKGIVSYIVCHNHDEAYRIAHQAQEMELPIAFPITFDEYLHRSYVGQNIDVLYIDNLRMLLQHITKPDVEIDLVVW